MTAPLDLSRLTELQDLLGTDVSQIVSTLVAELDRAIDGVAKGLAGGDLDAVALAAHSARNSALMVDARPLLERLAELERSARRADLAATRDAEERLLVAWQPLRRCLHAASGEAGGAGG